MKTGFCYTLFENYLSFFKNFFYVLFGFYIGTNKPLILQKNPKWRRKPIWRIPVIKQRNIFQSFNGFVFQKRPSINKKRSSSQNSKLTYEHFFTYKSSGTQPFL
jgi:hypothetical protein